jgi:uncharacterized protein YqfA (UPF0365 family)
MSILDSPFALVVCITAFVCAVLLIGSGALQPWLTSVFAKSPVSLVAIIGMKLRMMNASEVVMAYIVCRKAEMPTRIEDLEALYLSAPKQFVPEVQKLAGEHLKGKNK